MRGDRTAIPTSYPASRDYLAGRNTKSTRGYDFLIVGSKMEKSAADWDAFRARSAAVIAHRDYPGIDARLNSQNTRLSSENLGKEDAKRCCV